MQMLFGSSSHAIQLSSSEDEDDIHGRSLSSGFGSCMSSCLPRFNIKGGNIRLLEEQDATLDAYLDPNTTTTIEPLLDEYNNHRHSRDDNVFGGAVLQNSHRFLSRNPFASTALNDNKNGNNSGDSLDHDPPYHHSFRVAAPSVDFLMENDGDDAEFLSDHRISAVIGDTGKLASQFKLFDTEMDSGKKLEGDNDSATLKSTGDQHDDDNQNHATSHTQPFELDSNKTDLDDTTDTNQQPPLLQQDEEKLDQVSNTITDLSSHASDISCGLEPLEVPPATTVDKDEACGQPTSVADDTNASNSQGTKLDHVTSTPIPSAHAHDTELTTAHHSDSHHNDNDSSSLTAFSEPSSPIPTVFDSSPGKFPPMGLPRSSTPTTPEHHQKPLNTTSRKDDAESQHVVSVVVPSHTTGNSSTTGRRRRPSVASMAHSILGDKLDDFTEKLTYIRKNIISSLDDSEDDQDMVTSSPQQRWRPRSSSMMQNSQRQSAEPYSPQRSSSTSQLGQHYQHPKRSRSTSALAAPSHRSYDSSLYGVDEQQEMDQDDVFEFSKVIALGKKNVRHMSEDLMANGIRFFNDVSTRVKNANADRQASSSSFTTAQQQHHHHHQQPHQQQQEQPQSTNDRFLLSDTFI